MKLFLNWNARNAIVAAAMGYVSMTVSSSITSSSSSFSSGGQQQQQQGFGFVLHVAAKGDKDKDKGKECTCTYPPSASTYQCFCPNPNVLDDCCPAPPPTSPPSSPPSSSPTRDTCSLGDDVVIKLTDKDLGKNGKLTCGEIESKDLCDEEVKKKDGKKADAFCTSCGCGEDPPPDTCEGDDVVIKLTDKDLGDNGKLTCDDIKKENLCGEEVKKSDGKTADDFCTSCGCGKGGGDDDDDDDDTCKGDDDEIELEEKGFKDCGKIDSKGWCGKIVKDSDGKTADDFCTSCGCGEDRI